MAQTPQTIRRYKRDWMRNKYKTDPLAREIVKSRTAKWKKDNPTKNAASSLRNYYKYHENKRLGQRVWYHAHKDEINRKRRAYNLNNKDKLRGQNLRRLYGMSLEDYQALFVKQNGLCALCGLEEQNGKSMAVDHCHQTGNVRALLCGTCNCGLGAFDHDEELLQKAIAYIQSHRRKENTCIS